MFYGRNYGTLYNTEPAFSYENDWLCDVFSIYLFL